tara:strand:- start:96 stop:473 length:378 start_codon:yes stop_codon:yes gene_type:complete
MGMREPGVGRQLYQCAYSGVINSQPQVTYPLVATLTSNQYSEPYPLTAGRQGIVVIEFASAPGTTTTIEMASDPTFAKFDSTTIPAQSTTRAEWQSPNTLASIIRVKNTSDVSVTAVYANQLTEV